jgi:hypothetical protein
MRKIKEYDVQYEFALKDLVLSIHDAINEGWQPFGSVFLLGKEGLICQPVVKYEDEQK